MYDEYGLDTSVESWEEIKAQADSLDLDAVEDILSRRREPSNPSENWKLWQNALKRRQSVLRAGNVDEKLQEDFEELEEEYKIYGYWSLQSQERIMNILRKLVGRD